MHKNKQIYIMFFVKINKKNLPYLNENQIIIVINYNLNYNDVFKNYYTFKTILSSNQLNLHFQFWYNN